MAFFPAMAAGLNAASPVAPYFNGLFPFASPGSATGFTLRNAFPALTFVDPIWLCPVPGGNDLLVTCKNGQVWRLPRLETAAPSDRVLALDLGPVVQTAGDQGLYRVIFHPEFGMEGSAHVDDVFACYSHRPDSPDAGPDKSMWRVSRFQWQPASGTIDPASEEVLIQQFDPHQWHNGGAMDFDEQGCLLITCGDGGHANDYFGLSQQLGLGLFAGVLRIDPDNRPDVSHAIRRQPRDPAGKPVSFPPSFTQGYGIPHDNPWQDTEGTVLEEFFAIGLRSPHSATYDPVEQELWVGDVGQTYREEINRIRKGANCQWPYFEGTWNGPKRKASSIGTEAPPFVDYDRSYGWCVIGGFRYRGEKWSRELGGQVIYGDNGKGVVKAISLSSPQIGSHRTLASGLVPGLHSGMSAIATDADGEIYVLRLNGTGMDGGTILRLDAASVVPEPPALLSATGLFTDLATLTPAGSLIPYEVASPLWSDGAAKKRWMVLPNDGTHNASGERLTFSETENWRFPSGTILVKHFETSTDDRNPSVVKRLETRVMVCLANSRKYGVTYRWNEAGTDAVLLTEGEEISYSHVTPAGTTETRRWSFPSRSECLQCHTDATGHALGLRTHQINRPVADPVSGQPVNQLVLFRDAGYFEFQGDFDPSAMLRSAALDDESMPLEHRIRSYLDSNCAHCHQPGTGLPYFDARLTTPPRGQNLLDGRIAGRFDLGPDGRYLKPGRPDLSAVYVRAASHVPGVAMPPLGKHRADAVAMSKLAEYLSGLNPADLAGEATPTGRFFRLTSPDTRLALNELDVLDGRGMPIPSSSISVAAFSSRASTATGAEMVLDDNPATFWQTATSSLPPHFLTLDLGSEREIGGFIIDRRLNSGAFSSYGIELSTDGTGWTVVDSGGWAAGTPAVVRSDDINRKRPARVTMVGPKGPVREAFDVTLLLDTAVHDLTLDDFQATGGTVLGVRGSGYFRVVTVQPAPKQEPSTVEVRLPASAVHAAGAGLVPVSFRVATTDTLPPVATFGEPLSLGYGKYRIALTFSEPVIGLTRDDFRVSGGKLTSFAGKKGTQFTIEVAEDRSGYPLRADLPVMTAGDKAGNLLANAVSVETPPQFWEELSYRALEVDPLSGFIYSAEFDGDGTHVEFATAPDGSRGGVSTLNPQSKIVQRFKVARAGTYVVRSKTRADNAEGDSFYVSVNGSKPKVWNINRGPGEIGSGRWFRGIAGEKGAGYRYRLKPGMHTVEIFAREDGAKLSGLELVPLNPLPQWTTHGVEFVGAEFDALLSFTDPVAGLTASDFTVTGGQVKSLAGSGADYVVTVVPLASEVVIQLPANRAKGPSGQGNLASPPHRFTGLFGGTAAVSASLATRSILPPSDDAALLAHAFGLNLVSGLPLGLPRATLDPGVLPSRLVLHFVRRRGDSGLVYTPQFSDDASVWVEASAVPVVKPLSDEWEQVSVADEEGAGRRTRFARVRVEASGW